eukprot:TRINITY_DN1014_c0_g1_i5.p1 TRINITY_DN1014_c0_g1~~TRINITY_DN1014_c0_g1_i5.p1  ORF type:complete len:120 (-),score=10.26 TRINITY_DN1014_c0_g1_i5:141-500(-)
MSQSESYSDEKQILTVGEYFKVGLSYNSNPSQEVFYNILYWLKQILSIAFGVVVGSMHLTGIGIIIIYGISMIGFTYLYGFKYLCVDEDKVEATDMYTEGLMASFLCFILSWTLSHTFV